MNTRVKNYLLQMLNQFIPVVLGVYLGIVASNWNENRVQQAQQQEFINNLYLELEANKVKITQTLAYRQTILAEARRLSNELSRDTLDARFWSVGGWNLVPGWHGLAIPTLESSVYQTGLATNLLEGLDFNIINGIARTYNYQTDYKLSAQKRVFDELTDLGYNINTQQALNAIEPWTDVIYYEQEVIARYDEALPQLAALQRE